MNQHQELTRAAPRRQAHRPFIALIAPDGTLFHGLVRAIEAHSADSCVVLFDRLPPPGEPADPFDLVLLYDDSSRPTAAAVAACGAIFPAASIGLILDGSSACTPQHAELFASQAVQGLLPLTLKLDVWLAAVSLLLSGGEYRPHHIGAPAASVAIHRHEGPSDAGRGLPAPAHEPANKGAIADLQCLTSRERQILRLVAEGCQNKHIAHRMTLSEHTVKVHVHNVITKLGVSNRTQAAAAFRAGGIPIAAQAQAQETGAHMR